MSSLFVRKPRNRKPSQFHPETAGPAAALAAPSGTITMPPAGRSRPVRALMRAILAALSALLIVGMLAPLAPSPASAAAKPKPRTAPKTEAQ